MAATNPFLTSDLVSKYGWQIMPYLSNLGVNLLAESQILFVDSGSSNALDSDDTEHGHSFEKPLATLDYAVGLCTASQGDVILVSPGHTETFTTANPCTLDVAGITVIGIGTGQLRPTFSLGTNVGATIDITAANIRLSNVRVISALANITAGINVKTGATSCTIENCEIRDGNAAALEMVIGISVAADMDDIVIRNNVFSTVPSGGCASAVTFAGGSDRCRLIGNVAQGTYSAAAFSLATAASTEMIIKGNILTNQGAATLILHASCTGVVSDNRVAGTTSMAAAMTGYDLMFLWENYVVGEDAKSGAIIPAIDSE